LKSPIDTAFAAVVEPAVAAVVVETAVAGAVATALGVVVGAGAVVDDVESLLQPATASNNSVQPTTAMRERFTPVVRCCAGRG